MTSLRQHLRHIHDCNNFYYAEKSLIATENIQIIYAASTASSDPNYGAMFACYVNNVKVPHTYMGYALEMHTGDQFKAVINRDTNYSYTATGEIQIAVISR